ncbi:MAG: CotH kinase family protein [Cryomorphaceae bacterium]|nr:CotH kinase family protein [Cryomorphaceae bacterium]
MFLLSSLGLSGQIYINEFLASNQRGIVDFENSHEDWIEIYNTSSIPISLGGWYLSDRTSNLKQWKMPDTLTINPGGFILIWASGKDTVVGHEIHSNFSISRDGEPLYLSNRDGNIIDYIPPVKLKPDMSFGRIPDGRRDTHVFYRPTPGKSNWSDGVSPVARQLSFSHVQGYHQDDFDLTIEADDEGVEIYFTLDGRPPDTNAIKFSGAIAINDRVGVPNDISDIRSGVGSFWEPPRGEVPKIFAIRAKPFCQGLPCGEEIYGSFWTGHHNPEDLQIPIVSLIIDPYYMFDDEEGMYVPGVDYEKTGFDNSYRRGSAYERPASFTYFDSLGHLGIHQQVGVRINGGITRRAGQKSLRLYARNAYGNNQFEYPFFSDRAHSNYRRLLLNTPMGDWTKTVFKDELTTNLVKPLGLEYQAFRPIIVFLNGEYWALHFLKERRDRHFLSALSGVDESKIERLTNNMRINEGSRTHFQEMLNVLDNTPKNDPDYIDKIARYIDLNNFIDYHIVQIYLANYDWPRNNHEYWRPNTKDGKWRWIFYDLDASMRTYWDDNFTHYTIPFDQTGIAPDREWATHILRSLLENKTFRKQFQDRFFVLMQTTLSAENILKALDAITQEIAPHMPDYTMRWQIPRSTYEWRENISILENFAVKRPGEMMQILKQTLGNPFDIYPNPGTDLKLLFHKAIDKEDVRSISLVDMNGKTFIPTVQVLDKEIIADVSHLTAGQYVIQLNYNGQLFRAIWVKI